MRVADITIRGSEQQLPAAEALPPDTQVEPVIVRVELPFATDPVRLTLKDLVYLDAALAAEDAGADAVFVNSVADYGVDLARGALRIPVVGAGEAGIATALRTAPSFSFVTVWPASTQIYYDRVLAATGSTSACRSVRYVLDESELADLGGGPGVMDRMRDPASAAADRVLAAARSAVAEDGAASVVLGCTCMSRLAPRLSGELGVPVIDPLLEGVLAARRGAAAPAAGAAASTDTRDRVREAVDVWAARGAAPGAGWVDDCGDACAVLA